jgi:hypothetical protein
MTDTDRTIDSQHIEGDIDPARRSEQLAETLAREAMERSWTAFAGVVAMPTAAALGMASCALYALSFVERRASLFRGSGEHALDESMPMQRPLRRGEGRIRPGELPV